ncbi:MAG: hypothetical protein VX589_08995 [Myxococcota bacterium]|nr:hypothetical protein [Myxococcota bacterium]
MVDNRDSVQAVVVPRLQSRRQHLFFGWTMLFVFACVGTTLEALHGFKIGWYLDVGHETRRLMFTLAHAHGTLIGLIHIAFAATLGMVEAWPGARLTLISRALKIASVMMPGGFFAGGLIIHGGDPGLGIFLVPVGAAALILAFILIVKTLRSGPKS